MIRNSLPSQLKSERALIRQKLTAFVEKQFDFINRAHSHFKINTEVDLSYDRQSIYKLAR